MKLPVFKAIAATLAYFVTQIVTIVKILWLPTLILTGAMMYVMPDYLRDVMAASALEAEPDPAQMLALVGSMTSAMGLLLLVGAIVYPIMLAGLFRHIVRGEAPRLPFYLQFGGDEIRILLTFVLLAVMIVIVYTAGVVGVIAVATTLVALSSQIGGVVAVVLILAMIVALIWFSLRMSVALPAAVGARKIGIAESWRLTKGNAWRLFFYWLIWGLILSAAVYLFAALMAPQLVSIFGEMAAAANDPAAIVEIERRLMQMEFGMWDSSNPGFWVYAGGQYISAILSLGLGYSATGIAYRYLAGDK